MSIFCGGTVMEQEWYLERDVAGLAHLERLVITAGQLPNCMVTRDYECYDCPVERASPCPVMDDPDYRSYLLYLRDRYLQYQRKRTKQIDVLRAILTRHKLPLHWGNLAILSLQESPELFDSADSVRGLVYFNPNVFSMEKDGVFGLVEWRRSE